MILASTISISVHLSEDQKTATVHISGRSEPFVSGCLGVDLDVQGEIQRVYLDTLIHNFHPATKFEHWRALGAISTILHREPKEAR